MQPPPQRNVTGLIVWSTMLVVLTAAPIRNGQSATQASASQAPASQASAAQAPASQAPASVKPVVAHDPWVPAHKGHADLSTGVYIREDDDLVVHTPFPIVLRRTYNSGDRHPRQFGTDTTHPGEWWIYGKGDPGVPWGELILADGGRIRFTRISPGESRDGAVLRHDTTPGEFNGALLTWTGSLWEMRLRDGSVAIFASGAGPQKACALIERRDPDGHVIKYVRDASGFVSRMESEGQSITLEYDAQHRIVRAYDTVQNEVVYTYDDGGRLVRAARSNGPVRRYAYDSRNYLIRIDEPGRIVENEFDDSGRWAHQVVKSSEDDPDPYVASARYVVENGLVVESRFDEGDGLEVHQYNDQHRTVSETLYADTPTPVVFRYTLNSSNTTTGATMACTGAAGAVTRNVQLTVRDDAAKARAIRASCILRR